TELRAAQRLCLRVVRLCAIQHPQNQAVPNPVCHPAAGANLGVFPPGLLQRPPNGPAGLRGGTTTDDPERGGASGVQPTEKGTRHPATHRAPLAASSCSRSSHLCLPTECLLVLLPPT